MKRRKKQKLRYFRVLVVLLIFIIIIACILIISKSCNNNINQNNNSLIDESSQQVFDDYTQTEPYVETEPVTTQPEILDLTMEYPSLTPSTQEFTEDYTSEYAILLDVNSNEIIAQKNYNVKMYPASLTKIMSLIVAVENIENFDDTVLITADMIDPMIEAEASRAGFVAGETPTITDLLHGMALASGADATLALAEYVAGSEEDFVKLMNEKVEELGLKNTHFCNPVGLHDEQHYSTAEDISLILKYAMENEICNSILSTYQYIVPATPQNPEGLTITSTMFSLMTGEEMTGVSVKGGKTGFTDQAGNCLASLAEINNKDYICVLTGNTSRWYNVYETLSAYSVYGFGGEPYDPPQ